MKFIDEARIKLIGGHGGRGCVSFRREAFIPHGGPNGGNGGRGGAITFFASRQPLSLQDIRLQRVCRAKNGEAGAGAQKTGRDGADISIEVPLGTMIRDANTGELLADLLDEGATWCACKGGRGGKGNSHFVSSTHQVPKFAQPGEPGEEKEVSLELRLLADVGLLGAPNSGKSTLLRAVSHARPKVGDYAFTTLRPHLGVVQDGDKRAVVADIPGIIEGAHEGHGLGHQFLRHIERTRSLMHVLDASLGIEAIEKQYEITRNELGLFDPKLLEVKEYLVLNKCDMLDDAELNQLKKHFPQAHCISALHTVGIDKIKTLLCATDKEPITLLPDARSLRP